MSKICFILGSTFLKDYSFAKMKLKVVITKYGKVKFYSKNGTYYLQRHGAGIPPHIINHKANITAIKELGITNIIAINSCGSLKEYIVPGTVVVPDDYIDLQNDHTFFDAKMVFTVPRISERLRKAIIAAGKKAKVKPVENGVYIQTKGPRFETKAEIKFFSAIADIVGMTLANEATLANELGLEYASICTIDNYANGIGKKELMIKEIFDAQKNNSNAAKKMMDIIKKGKI
jgi:5'-methylthioadenosine phosphorylase